MNDFSIQGILSKMQRVQQENLGKRAIGITAYTYCLNIVIFESGYDDKEDGDIKNFNFYDSTDAYAREAEYRRMMDYLKNA